MSGTDLLEREQQAGNEADNLNPGDKSYHNKVGRSSDENDNTEENSGSLDEPPQPKYGKRGSTHLDSHGDTVKNNPNSSDGDTNENIERARELEENSGIPGQREQDYMQTSGFGGKLNGKVKKGGPSAGVVGLLLFGVVGLGGGSVGLASTLLVNIKEIFHNDRADATRSNREFARASLSNRFNSADKTCGANSIPIKCKMTTIKKDTIKEYQDKGFKFEGDEIDSNGQKTGNRVEDDESLKSGSTATSKDPDARVSITRVTYPDGATAQSGQEFFDTADSSPNRLRYANNASDERSKSLLSKTFTKYLEGKFGFLKGQRTFPDGEGDNGRATQDRAFNDQADLVSDEDGNNGGFNERASQLSDEAAGHAKTEKLAKGGAAGAVVQGFCSIYHLARVGETVVKIYHGVQMAKFALMFFQAADEIKDGRGDGPKTTYLMDNVTYVNSDKKAEDYNLSATDSEGYKIAAQGDTSALKSYGEKFLIGGAIGQSLSTFTSTAEKITKTPGINVLPGISDGMTERQKMKVLCRAANSPLALAGTACVPMIPSLTALGTVVPGIGNAIGLAAGAVGCACSATLLTPAFIQKMINLGMKISTGTSCEEIGEELQKLANLAIEGAKSQFVQDKVSAILKDINISSDRRGVDAGNIIAAGAGVALSGAGLAFAMKPAKNADGNKEVSDYLSATQTLEDKYLALSKEDARNNPLDINNEYSIVGSLVHSLDLGGLTPTSLYGSALTLSSLFPSAASAALGGQKANALYTQPTTASKGDGGRYSHCKNQDLIDAKMTCDPYGNFIGVSSVSEILTAKKMVKDSDGKIFSDLTDWMASEQSTTEENGGTSDTEDCALLDGTEDDGCKSSRYKSIEKDGTPVKDSQYSKYLMYCGVERKAGFGAQIEGYEQGSERDQNWYNGTQCTSDSQMMLNFRNWTKLCVQAGVSDGTTNCYTDDATQEETSSTSECANGGPSAIYTCALKYDNYQYKWGGGHGDIPDAKKWIDEFNGGKIPEWEAILDCSGLVRMAFVEAMGIEDSAYVAPGGYDGSKYWKKISLEEAKQGDIITSSGHVAIVESNDVANKKFKIFHASTSGSPKESNILHGEDDYGSVIGAYRAYKGESSI